MRWREPGRKKKGAAFAARWLLSFVLFALLIAPTAYSDPINSNTQIVVGLPDVVADNEFETASDKHSLDSAIFRRVELFPLIRISGSPGFSAALINKFELYLTSRSRGPPTQFS